jgi:hypothetical protein
MTCYLCNQPIEPRSKIHWHHHQELKCKGGTETAPTHPSCHRQFHSANNHYREFGRIGGLITAATKRWSLNLKNVRTDSAHEINRQFYRAFYSKG